MRQVNRDRLSVRFLPEKQLFCFSKSKSGEKLEKWVVVSPIRLEVKRNRLAYVVMVVFTIQIFVSGIKRQGLNCKPDCVHIREKGNQDAAELKS